MRYTPAGTFALPLSAGDAIRLFTPEGERDWVTGWEPAYPHGTASETPGTIFTTHANGVPTIWVVIEIDHESRRASYGRITPGCHAGTVSVRVSSTGSDTCAVNVAYDMTLLVGADPSLLEMYQRSRFDEVMREWTEALETFLSRAADEARPSSS